jgi:hypothetical protein
MFSAVYNRLDDMKFLIDAGADLYIRNYEIMDFYNFLMEDEKGYILTLFPDFLSEKVFRLDRSSIKALSRRIN